ncbi:MAG TPA: restriction endonuclease subunit S [Burkholderiaceae bacterium]|nr:restriction endonuclease subunit S [Burkholderiaceae bacterium]
MTAGLPEGWDVAPIGTVARVVGGGTPPSHDPDNFAPVGHGISWVTPADLSGYRSQSISRGARDLSEAGLARCGATLMPKGTVLFSSRAPIGYVAIAANEISTNQGFKSFILPAEIDPRFVYWQLKHLKPEAEAIATGTTFKELSGAAAATLPLRIAPVPEQTRIADQLDTLLARIQACQDRLEAIPALLKRFRELILDAAIDGSFDSTQDQPSRRTKRLSLADICLREKRAFGIGPFGSDLKVADYRSEGVPLVFVRDVRARRFGGENTKFVSAEKAAQLTAHTVQAGDLLITKMGDPPGDTAIYPMDRPTAVMTADVVRMRVDPLVADVRYVSYWFESTTGRRLIASITAGVAQRKVSLERLKSLAIDLPDPGVQSDVALRVERLLAVASHLAARVGAAQKIASRLGSLTLSKAFRGELVPQDPNDEPASWLVARIAAQRNAPTDPTSARTPRRGRPPRAPKESATMTKSRQDHDVMGQPYLAGHLRRIGTPASAEALFKVAELPVADFYKQLAWEVKQGHVKDNRTTLEPGHAAG